MSAKHRFSGVARLYGEAALQQFAHSHVVVVGIGGVGTWVAEGLARSGIGIITLIDLDDICITNTNRQIHALANTIGSDKTEVMSQRIAQINPECRVNCIEDFITTDNLPTHFNAAIADIADIDYVVDAVDDVQAKAALINYCKRNKIKIITVGGAGGQTDPRLITTADLAKTIQCPLSAKVRSELRRHYQFSTNPKRRFGIECVYSTEQLMYPQGDGTVSRDKINRESAAKLDCDTGFGASVAVTATFGFVAVSRVLEKLTLSRS